MSNLFTQLSQAAEQQRQEVHDSRNKQKIADSQREAAAIKQDDNKEPNNAEQNVSSHSEPTSSPGDTTKSKAEKTSNQMEVLDADLMIQIIKELSIAKDNYSTTLRISQEEKKFIEDFIHVDLRRKDVEGNGVSKSKLMRYAFTYVVLNHRKDFANALVAALKEEKKIGLLT